MYTKNLFAIWMAGSLLALPATTAGKWRMQYFYDQDRSDLVINDLQFPSAVRGVAIGSLDDKGKQKPVSVSTDDGGAHWTVTSLKEVALSLFFLDDTLGWMVAPKAIYRTEDAGRTWTKLPKSPELLIQVYFLDPDRGFAIGTHKSAYQTTDGGKTWTPIAAAAEPQTNAEYTVYNSISFATPNVGLITGYSAPPRADDTGKPDWLTPETTTVRREWPHVSIMLDTRDGGKTWKSSTSSMFGRITKAVFAPDGAGLGLIEFTEQFKWPSEVHRLNGTNGKSTIVYNATDRAITDVLLQPSGTAYLAGVEVTGKMQHTPFPRKLKILKSSDLENWQEMDVDYRAVAVRAMLRSAPGGSLWVATDTGMILKLVE